MDTHATGGRGLRARRPRGSAGFSLVEVMASVVIIVTVILGHVASVGYSHRAAAASEEKGLALVTLQRFVERLRSDTNWSSLYGRLRTHTAEGANDANLSQIGTDLTLTTVAPSTYYADFVPPAKLGTVTVLVQVPVLSANGVPALRETLSAPRYGLPADLNGDGVVNDVSQNFNYHVLPVVVRLRWQQGSRTPEEVVIATWLRRGV
jgi:Tfp pilus assembly protein PilE